MKITRVKIQNYRLLENFSLDLEDDLSLVIGKNNTGKTSILSIFDRFLNHGDRSKFSFDDFSVRFKNDLKRMIEEQETVAEDQFLRMGIFLTLFIKYEAGDDLANLSGILMDLDPANNIAVLGYDYSLGFESFLSLRAADAAHKTKETQKKRDDPTYVKRGFFDLMRDAHSSYFESRRLAYGFDVTSGAEIESESIDLNREGINTANIINFKYISAGRGLSNQNMGKRLSMQTSRIYERTEVSDEQGTVIEKFKDRLSEADVKLTDVYRDLFSGAIEKVKSFGGVKTNESEVEIISSLQHRQLLEGNTTVVYRYNDDHKLPESHNGLGYMNLISMIFEIEILVQEFQRNKSAHPADINLLFIEEPEAHTHRQMQYVFIKNIKRLLSEGIARQDGQTRPLQYIITTHSSHIVADSDFDDIKYLRRGLDGTVTAKNLKDLKAAYGVDTTQYQFLAQYLTISRAEAFFADKIILIEGDTERILMPTLMQKLDLEEAEKHRLVATEDPFLPLRSQNISTIEVGAYGQIFEKFVDFLGIKTLLITDLDSVNAQGEACRVALGTSYSNSSLAFFFGDETLDDLKSKQLSAKQFSKTGTRWITSEGGPLCIVYQIVEGNHCARSFEECFIHSNLEFVRARITEFKGIKNPRHFGDTTKDVYDLAELCIKKKTHFALDIVYHSNLAMDNWTIPAYIKEGLLWLKKD